ALDRGREETHRDRRRAALQRLLRGGEPGGAGQRRLGQGRGAGAVAGRSPAVHEEPSPHALPADAVTLTLLDAGRAREVTARIDGERVTMRSDDVQRALGLTLTPEGLCGHGLCIPVADPSALSGPDGLDLGALAQVLDRPLAVDTKARAAYLGVA